MKNTLLTLVLAGALIGGQAHAGEIMVFTSGAMIDTLKAAGEDYSKASGDHLTFFFGTTGAVAAKVRAGEAADVIVVPDANAKALQAEGHTASTTPFANAILGVAAKVGAPKPDISTTAKFKQAMLDAKTLAYPDPKLGAASGVYIDGLWDRLGIGAAARAKAVLKPNGVETDNAVGTGEAVLGLSFITELLPDKRLAVVGPFPEDIQSRTLFSAAVSSHAANAAGAKAFIAYITSPAAKAKVLETGAAPANP